jgi:hypothetical protein
MLSNQHCTVRYIGHCLAGCIVARCASDQDQAAPNLLYDLGRSRRRLQIVKPNGFNLTKINPINPKDESRHISKDKNKDKKERVDK